MTENIPKICAMFEIWQDNDCIRGDTALELIMRYLADDPEIDHIVSDEEKASAYQDYIGRQNENLNAKTLIIQELNNQITQLKAEQLIDEGCVGCAGPCDVVAAKLQKTLAAREDDIRVKDSAIMLEAKLAAHRKDSGVLMKVVEIVKRDDPCPSIVNQLADALVDYLDVPEELDVDGHQDISITVALLERL